VITGTTSARKLSTDVRQHLQRLFLMGMSKLNEELFFSKNETKGNPLRLFKTEPLQKRNGNDKLNEQVVLNKKLSSPAIIVIGEV
jgi:uroporphyrin-III C-methyltransferase